jgi:ethylbenzene hydroxylase subunit beta/complex iron-sulfur molybdoenzyme family reductase subunit beta
MAAGDIGRVLDGKVVRPKRQLAMVFDLNKCLGCQTCTIACKTLWTGDEGMKSMWWTVVNTMPGQGTPRNWEESGGGFREDGRPRPGRMPTKEDFGEAWEFNYDEVFYEGKGQSTHLKPKGDAPKWGPNWDEDQGAGEYPNSYYFYLPRICNHCTHPACLEACPRKAILKREEDGIVLIDEDRCKGYRFCVEACPYKRIYFNFARGIAQKCIFCFPRLEKGVAPACARQCPGRLRFVGYLDDPEGPIHKLVHKWRVALPLHPDLGTDPNVYYVPPISPPRLNEDKSVDRSKPRIPTEYLRNLFGSGVDAALETLESEMAKRRGGEKSELMDTLIVYRWPENIFPDFPENPGKIEWS